MNVRESRIGRRVVVGLALSVAATVSAAPAEYVWTGAQNAYWTNAANWTVGGAVAPDAPGVRFTTKDWQTVTNLNATASFGAVAGGAPTTIDLDGLFFVSNLVVKAGAPKYTFGTEGQYLGLAHEGGRFTVEKGAAAPAVAGVYGFLWYPGMKESKPDTYDTPDEARFVNESEGELVLSNFGNTSPNAPSSGIGGTWCRFIGLSGAGDIRIDSWSKKRTSVALNLYPEGAQRLLLVGTTADPKTDQLVRGIQVGGGRKATVVVVEKTLELGQGTEVTTGKKKMPVVRVRDAGTRLTFTGDGVVGLHGMNQKSKPETFGKGFVPAGANIDAGAELIFACKVDGFCGSNAVTQKSPQESFYFHRGAGTLSFTRTDNAFEGGIDLLSFDKNATLAFTDPGQMGPGAIRIGNAGRLLYTGTEALAFGKDLAITNKTVGVDYEPTASVDASATVEQGGAGALTVTSPVDVSGTGGTAVLTLANSTAVAATWAGVLTDAADSSTLALAKTGSGAWTLTAKNAFTGGTTVTEGTLVLAAEAGLASPVTVRGGATFAPAKGATFTFTAPVTIEDGGSLFIAESQTLPFALAFSGTAKLLVGPGADVVIPAEGSGPAAAGGKLVLCLEENARVKMSDGSKPDWLGFASPRGLLMPMKVDEDGFFELVETSWKGADGAAWTDAANWTKGVPTVDCAAIVNAAGTVEVPAGAAAVAVGTVELDAGTVSVKGTLPIEAAANVERFVIGPEGALDINGGTVTAKHALGAEDYALHLEGGCLALTGAATLDLRASKGLLGTGSVTVDTTAGAAIQVMKADKQEAVFSTGDAEGTLDMTVGPGAFEVKNTGYLVLGDRQKGTFRLTLDGAVSGRETPLLVKGTYPRGFVVGRQSGNAEVVLRNGRLGGVSNVSKQGVIVAETTGADACVTGRVVVAGGEVYASSVMVGGTWSGIGFGVSTQKTDPSAVRGELKLVDGLVQVSNKSPLGFGVGNATGVGLQTGGTVDVTQSAGAAVLGYGSGTGEYVLSNGTFATGRPLYVGGCRKADVQEAYYEGVSHAGDGAATGRLFARGGTLAATNELGIVVGADGRGRLEIGPDGNVTAKALVVSNNVEGVLAFELGARKAGTLKADKLVIAPGAKLEIDARALAADSSGTIHLADCGAVEGLFAASDVTILLPIGQEKRFAHAMILTERSGKKGLWLMLQPRGLIMVIR